MPRDESTTESTAVRRLKVRPMTIISLTIMMHERDDRDADRVETGVDDGVADEALGDQHSARERPPQPERRSQRSADGQRAYSRCTTFRSAAPPAATARTKYTPLATLTPSPFVPRQRTRSTPPLATPSKSLAMSLPDTS